MANNLYVTMTEQHSGRSGVLLGVMQLLSRQVRKVAFFRPVITEPAANQCDPDTDLLLKHFKLEMKYEDAYAYTLKEARDMYSSDQRERFLENVLAKYKQLENNYDFVVCEGTDFLGADTAFEFDLNADIALNLDCPVLLVSNAFKKTATETIEASRSTIELFTDKGVDVPVVVISRSDFTMQESQDIVKKLSEQHGKDAAPLVYVMPNDPVLAKPTMSDVQKTLNAEVLYGQNRMDNIVHDFSIAAMQMSNFLPYISQGQLVITPGDRSDIILASLTSRLSTSYPDVSGLLLTGGLKPSASVQRLINGLVDGVPMPILSVESNTFQTLTPLLSISSRISPDDYRKINTALGLFENSVDSAAVAGRLVNRKSTKMTPKMFEYMLIERAKRHTMRVVMPEGEEERILRAAEVLCNRGVAEIILLGNLEKIQAKIKELGLCLDKATIIQPDKSEKFKEYVDTYFELRKAKGINRDEARDKMLDATYYGTMMVHLNDADGMVSGAINTTAHTIRPAFEFIKTKPGAPIVSSVFFMCMKDHVLVFGDCAVNPNPTAKELAVIATGSAETAKVFGVEPRVAMLSYSTGTSGKGQDVDMVTEATKLAKEIAPDLPIEGPIQYDAAIDPSVAATKMPNSPVAGKATVFIFPDLNTGNNTYKAVQRAAGAIAIGPVLQGLNKPVNDLSRGATVPDIINTVAITAIQAQSEKGLS